MVGLSKDSDVRELIIKDEGGKTATRYTVREEPLNLAALAQEQARLEAELAQTEPNQEELAGYGMISHPYYQRDIKSLEDRLAVVATILEAATK